MSQPQVEVTSGDWEHVLGHGRLVGYVDVWVYQARSGRLLSHKNAERKPLPAETCDMEAMGASLVCIQDNPKIVLDSGEVVYGCFVWWRFLDEGVEPEGALEPGEPPPARIRDVVLAMAEMALAEGWQAATLLYETVLLEQMEVEDWWWVRRLKAAIKSHYPKAKIGDKTALDIYTALALFMADAMADEEGMTKGEHKLWGTIRDTKRKNS